ncbi:PEGA domain-containing protein [Persicimonas caeni]|uniref:PEGA domain-containing protein n=1 Tax=Persicimonas caeni TaxID=2292766 RepID=A0A4Y6PTY6_PERCE|nr:serine/threonine-protein kinase [Persicimonas caeni]QDG51791.1 PEGA domain-containing protein [Persicimonas caeni]QED33012.1 protein kinase [Persicimonas caeni]
MPELTQENSTPQVPPKLPHIGQVIDGRYRVESVIATGGMGVVLRAEHVAMEREVALKLLHPHIAATDATIVERFHREVQLAKTLDHRNTIRLYDSGKTEEGLLFVAMEYLDGETLDELLARRGALRVWRAVDLTLQMLDGLAEAHARDFVHRDIKPSNVFVARNRRGEDVVKLLDFGIAKPLVDAGADLTGTGTICGTPNYVAPEYLRSEPIGKACDVYAVGLILLEMLCGQRVFEGDSPMETMTMRLQTRPQIPFLIEESPLAGVIRKAVAIQPEDRYADADEMYRALRPVAERLPAELLARRVDRPEPVGAPRPAPQRTEGSSRSATRVSLYREEPFEPVVSPRVAAGAAAALAVLAGVGVALLLSDDGASSSAAPATSAPAVQIAPVHPEESGSSSVSSTEVPSAADSSTSDSPPVSLEFVVDSEPAGARVERGNEFLGSTPLSVEVPRDELPATLNLAKDGFTTASVELSADASELVFERLNPQSPPEVAQPTMEATESVEAPKQRQSKRSAPRSRRPAPKPVTEPKPAETRDISEQKVEKVLDELLVE